MNLDLSPPGPDLSRQTIFHQDVASVFLVFIRLQIDSRRTFRSHPAFTF